MAVEAVVETGAEAGAETEMAVEAVVETGAEAGAETEMAVEAGAETVAEAEAADPGFLLGAGILAHSGSSW
jgi:hypothetical protein